jgi:hypothetical protein
MTLNFPNAPTNGQIFEGYQYNTAKGVWARTNFSALEASTTNPGIVQLATAAEMLAGAATTRAVTPVGLSPLQVGYRLVETLYITTNTNFIKASYPWLRAIRVRLVGGGAGGGGASATAAGQASIGGSGGGGAYAESFITNIAGLAGSVAVTVGVGGAGASPAVAGGVGGAGGATSFGSTVSAGGAPAAGSAGAGAVPFVASRGNAGGDTAMGELTAAGGSSDGVLCIVSTVLVGVPGGTSFFGPGPVGALVVNGAAGVNGNNAVSFGSGGSGGANPQSQAVVRTGGAGAPGIVIIELYA